MKPKTLILMVVAIGCGLVASVMTSRLIADRDSGEPQEKKVKVLVTKGKIRAFDLIKEPEKLFVEKEVAESSVPKKALRSFDEVKDKRPLRPLAEESFVNPDDLVNKDLNGLAAQLQPGTRAVAIKVNPESLAGGFVLPSSRVDILFTLRKSEQSATYNILQNMLILAVDMNATSDPEKQGMLGNTVTLSARPEEAQALTMASLSGDLRLSLRPIGDDKPVSTRGYTIEDLTRPRDEASDTTQTTEKNKDDLTSMASLIPPLPPLPAPPEPTEEPMEVKPEPVKPEPVVKKHTLTLIQGDQVQKVTFIKGAKEEDSSEPQPQEPTSAPAVKPTPPARKPTTPPAAKPATPGAKNPAPAQPSAPRGTRE